MKKIYVILLFSFIPFFALGILAARYYVQHEPFVGVVKANSSQEEFQTGQTTLVLVQANDLALASPKLIRMDVLFILEGEEPSVKIMQIFPSSDPQVDLLLVSQFSVNSQYSLNDEFDETLRLAYDFHWDSEILIDQAASEAILDWGQGIDISETAILPSSTTNQPDHPAKLPEFFCNLLTMGEQIDLSQFPDSGILEGHFRLSGEPAIFEHLLEFIRGGQRVVDCEILPPN